ncbi:ABC transporter permease [Microbacterium sp. LS_15]|uniref:ABC transporter permease n=1 Tax=Microbacterium sp. LS_15 TaxID=3055790 RepID=UPI0035C02D49
MTNVVRSEVLRWLSGTSVVAIYLVAVLMPVFVLLSDGGRLDLAGIDAGAATTRLLGPLAWAGVSAAFVGAYGVTRECYYASLGRTLTGVGFVRVFWGKILAGVVVGLVLVVGLLGAWTVIVGVLLHREGLALSLEGGAWRVYGGAVLGAALGASIGVAIGWIVRNYYLAAGLIILVPLALDFAMLRAVPEVARFSPGLALAALGAPDQQHRMLDFVPALGVSVAWALVLIITAWWAASRRRM